MPVFNDRRSFIKTIGLAGIPMVLPLQGVLAHNSTPDQENLLGDKPYLVNFAMDGFFFSPQGYIEKLREIDDQKPIEEDVYLEGGGTSELEEKFARITGKEKAVYLPTGTMANQVAVKLLSGKYAKVLVPENAHIYRDEADAAQRIHQKRLVPYGTDGMVAGLDALKHAEKHTLEGEVFQSGLNTVVVECPVRRVDGRVVPFDELQRLAAYCREQGYKMHLDGARLHLASVYTGIPVADYAALFDSVYISLYKYLNAGGGAVLCGEATLIDQVKSEMKVLGGTMWQSWYNTVVAGYYLEGFEERWKLLLVKTEDLIRRINGIEGLKISAVENGTNVYRLETGDKKRADSMVSRLVSDHQIYLRSPDARGDIWFCVNESTADISNTLLEDVFREAWGSGKS